MVKLVGWALEISSVDLRLISNKSDMQENAGGGLAVEGSSAKLLLPTLEASRIPGLPDNFYYIPDFITHEEEASIIEKVRLAFV